MSCVGIIFVTWGWGMAGMVLFTGDGDPECRVLVLAEPTVPPWFDTGCGIVV